MNGLENEWLLPVASVDQELHEVCFDWIVSPVNQSLQSAHQDNFNTIESTNQVHYELS